MSPIIAIEEHYITHEIKSLIDNYSSMPAQTHSRLNDHFDLRIKEMDEAGIDIQVLSHNHPGAQIFSPETAADNAMKLNDELATIVSRHPKRFAAFASLPMQAPEIAASELERCVTKKGMCGAMLHGMLKGEFFDLPKYWPVFAKAEELDVPIYLHPGVPDKRVSDAYYEDYTDEFKVFKTAGWGFGIEMSTAAVRMVLSGIFEKHQNLKIILGHLGEGLPFLIDRTHEGITTRQSPNKRQVSFRDTFCKHFYITTSGNFSDSALLCSLMEMGSDKILFAVDWPYNNNKDATSWIKRTKLSPDDYQKITHLNAQKLLNLNF